MYAYFATAAASGATIKAIKCRLVKDSSKEYIVCLKNHSLEVYSLPEKVNGTNGHGNDGSNLPILTTTLNANSTFVYFIEYRPPGDNQSHLLVLTHNYTLLLLTYDDVQSKFVSRSLASLQDDFSTPKYGNIIFKVDSGYNLLLFYGHSMVIKCIVLNKKNYFIFTDIVTMRTNDSLFLDIEFMSVEYKASSKPKSGVEPNSVSFSGSLNQDMQFKTPSKNTMIEYLECKLLILGQDTSSSSTQVEPVRWLYGMQLSFEIEILNEYKRFNSYIHVPLLGDPFNLSSPYNKFIPLSLNSKNEQFDSVMMLGPGSVGYANFKNFKEVKNFRLDYSITEISCYVKYGENKYVFADDNGSVYMMELYLSSSTVGTGLKRRVSSFTSSSAVYTTKVARELMVNDVVVNRIGSCSVPSSIVKLDENRVFCTSRMGNSTTIEVDSNGKHDEQQFEYKEWTHTNLGPITDFVHMEDSPDGTRSMLACCGLGSSGCLCKIYLGLASENLFSNEVAGVQNLFCVPMFSATDSNSNFNSNSTGSYSVLCLSFYRFTQFYLVNLSSLSSTKPSGKKVSLLDHDETRVGEITKLDKNVFVGDENTVLFKKLKNGNIVQVTTRNVLVVDGNFNLVKKVSLSNLLENVLKSGNSNGEEVKESGKKSNKNRDINSKYSKESEKNEVDDLNKKTVALSLLCGDYLLIVVSDNRLMLLDYNLNVVKSKKLEMSVSSVAYISQNDLNESVLKNYKGLKDVDSKLDLESEDKSLGDMLLEGMLAVSSWDNRVLVLSLKGLEVLHLHSFSTNFGTFVNSMKFVKVGVEVYLLMGVSDGKLYVYNISESGSDKSNEDNDQHVSRESEKKVSNKQDNQYKDKNNTNTNISKESENKSNNGLVFKLDNMLEMTNKSFKLMEINRYHNEDTCDLGRVNIITSGQKCNIIYMENNKMEYAKTNLTNLTALTTLTTGVSLSRQMYNNTNKDNNNTNTNISKENREERDHNINNNSNNSKENRRVGNNTGVFDSSSDDDDELLVVYYDNKNLYISKLNVVKNMNLQRVLTGRSFNKVVYHNKTKLAVLSTIPEYLVDSNNMKNYDLVRNMSNSNTSMDDKTVSRSRETEDNKENSRDERESNRKGRESKEDNQDLKQNENRKVEDYTGDYGYEEEDTNMLMCIDDNEVLKSSNTLKLPSCLMLVDLENKEVIYTLDLMEGHQVSSLLNYSYQGVEYVVAGSAKVSECDDEPVEGFLYFLEIDSDGGDSYRIRVQKTRYPFEGGLVELSSFHEMLVVAVNSTVLLMKPNLKPSFNTLMRRDRDNQHVSRESREGDVNNREGTETFSTSREGRYKSNMSRRVEINTRNNKKVYMLEYVEKEDLKQDENKDNEYEGYSRNDEKNQEEENNYLEIVTSYECNTYVVSMDTCGDSLLVGDLMTSVKMLKFKDNYLYEVCRDFKTLWTTSLVAIDENKCLVSDDSGNFIVFSNVKNPVNDQQSIQFESLGLFHHGEIVNKMMKLSKKETQLSESNGNMASKLGKKLYTCNRPFCCQTVKNEPEEVKAKKYTNLFDNLYTCVTSSGSILQVCFFDDLKLFLKLSVLEQTMLLIQSEIGNNFNRNHRNFQNLHSNSSSRGFLDGDLIESFLKLPEKLKAKVFNSILMNSHNLDLELTTLNNLVSDIENIRHSRLQ